MKLKAGDYVVLAENNMNTNSFPGVYRVLSADDNRFLFEPNDDGLYGGFTHEFWRIVKLDSQLERIIYGIGIQE